MSDTNMSHAVLQPILIGSSRIRNRLGLGPINPGLFGADGAATQTALEFYSDYSRRGVGIVYLGGVAVSSEGRSNAGSLKLQRMANARGIAALAERVQSEGSHLFVQLMHSGRQASTAEVGGRRISASPIACEVFGEIPEAATGKDILRVVRDFAKAARIVERSGAAAIEIHAAHGYLLSAFLSPASNRRMDEYGGTTARRFRILREVLDAVKCVTSIPVGVRVNVAENSGISGITMAQLEEGLSGCIEMLDFLSVSAGMYARQNDLIIPRRTMGVALWRERSRRLKQSFRVPVFLAGNVSSIDMASLVIDSGDADVVLMVRSLLADPAILEKWAQGQVGDVDPCRERYLCKYHSRGAATIYCPYNAVLRSAYVGREKGIGLAG